MATPPPRPKPAAAAKLLRTRAVVGTKEERQNFKAQHQAVIRERALAKMTPEQRQAALKKEGANKTVEAAKTKRAADNKLLRTKAITGTKAERQTHKQQRTAVIRERALARMSPERREVALKKESTRKAATEAKAKREGDNKILRTKAISGSKEEREAFKAQKTGILRERALAKMTPEQRETALKKEAQNKEAKEQQDKKKADDKIRRTVAKVGDKEEREKFREDKDRVAREDKLAKMTPEENAAFLAREEQARQAKAEAEKREAEEKQARTVAVVGDKEERQKFRASKQGKPEPERQGQERQQPKETAVVDAPPSVPPTVNNSQDASLNAGTAQAWQEAQESIDQLLA